MENKIIHRVYSIDRLGPKGIDDLILILKPLYLWYSPLSTDQKIRGRLQEPKTSVDILFDEERCIAFAV